MTRRPNWKIPSNGLSPISLLVILALFSAHNTVGTLAFLSRQTHSNNNKVQHGILCRKNLPQYRRKRQFVLNNSMNVGYEYLPPNPDASPGSFHLQLRSSYPPGTPPGLRGEAVRSALVTTNRCVGWNLSTNPETSNGGLLQISGRGTLDFLNGKLTRDFSKASSSYKESCLLDAKGRLLDVLKVSMDSTNTRALVLTSPGHTSSDLLQRLDPFVFPMDEVELTNFGFDNQQAFTFSLASTQYKHIQDVMMEQSKLAMNPSDMVFPGSTQSTIWKLQENVEVLVVPTTGISTAACVGYTFCFFGSSESAALGQQVWERLIGEDNVEGPVEVGALEYETLRVEAGQPAFGYEYGIDRSHTEESSDETDTISEATTVKQSKKDTINTGPMELHFNSLVDLDKGCYLGQEGIASVLKNPRGAPRTLYSVVFEDEFNTYDTQTMGDNSDIDNLTTLPKPGQKLYALGSNEELLVGTITSMGEAGGTGSRYTVGLALVKRADSIRKKMKQLDLEIPRDPDDFVSVDAATGSGIIQPPPMDPLEGLEVIVEGTFTMGTLKAIPSRRSGMRPNSNMFDPSIQVEEIDDDYEPAMPSSAFSSVDISEPVESENSIDTENDEDSLLSDLQEMEAEVAKATAEAEAAAAEAKRKAEKMELLKQRAEEAMARRKAKAAAVQASEEPNEEDEAAAEAKRKAEKMALLKQRADEAMARRKAKKQQDS